MKTCKTKDEFNRCLQHAEKVCAACGNWKKAYHWRNCAHCNTWGSFELDKYAKDEPLR